MLPSLLHKNKINCIVSYAQSKRDQCLKIVTLRDAGKSWQQIFNVLGGTINVETIRYRYNRFKNHGVLSQKKGAGRPKKTTNRQDRFIIRQTFANRRMTLHQLRQDLSQNSQGAVRVSINTISRRLKSEGIKSYVPVKKPLLTQAQKSKRLDWAKRYRHWSIKDWEQVVFSDESMFRTYSHRRTQRVWRRKREKFHPACIDRCVKNPLGVMVWGAISSKGVSQLKLVNGTMNSKAYQDNIINDIKLQCECIMFPNKYYIFQQDNAPCHNSASTRAFIRDRGVDLLEWPSNSPALSPIETVWSIVKRRIGRMPNKKADLWRQAQHIWYSIKREDLKALYSSMPDRIQAVIKAKGDVTKY